MYIFNKLEVTPTIPSKLERIEELVYNTWWTWNTDFLKLFKQIDEEVWSISQKNPVKFLKLVSQEKLEKIAENDEFMKSYNEVVDQFDKYMNKTDTYFAKNYPEHKDDIIAYFSAEYGLDETMPIYSGGLGVLSGDHMKTASDIGMPYVGIGLLYKEGYFEQRIDGYGNQVTKYSKIDLDNMPILPVKDENGDDLKITVNIKGEDVFVKVWKINVGSCLLYTSDAADEQ